MNALCPTVILVEKGLTIFKSLITRKIKFLVILVIYAKGIVHEILEKEDQQFVIEL
jgi:hypothetical protein